MTRLKYTIPTLLLAFTLAGCGVSTEGSDKQVEKAQEQNQTEESTSKPKATTPKLPSRPAGVTVIDGRTRGSLTSIAATRYSADGGSSTVTLRNNGEAVGFKEFCQGKIDMVDSARPISRSEYQLCAKNGISVVQFQTASDAIVLATKAETDIGVDCLPAGKVKEMYRAGSPLYNWNQLGYDNVPLRVTGPDSNNNAFGFFGRYILGSEEPTLQDFRSDYRAQETDRGVRTFVTGSTTDAARARRLEATQARVTSLRSQIETSRATMQDALDEQTEARRQVRKGEKDKRAAAQQQKDKARMFKAERAVRLARADRRALELQLKSAQESARTNSTASKRIKALEGRVGYFRFSYYELYEDQLRPIEIDASTDGKRNCIFPSQRTVTNAVYPFSRQLLITVSTTGLKRPETRDFLSNYLKNAPTLAEEQRLVPLPDSVIAEQQQWLAGTRKPTLVKYETKTVAPTTPKATTPVAPK